MLNKYLKLILIFIGGIGLGIIFTTKKVIKLLDAFRVNIKKNQLNCNILIQWMWAKTERKNIEDYLKNKGYHVVAIYGMNYLGEILLKELTDSSVQILYAVDKRAEYIDVGIDVLHPDVALPDVDALIVTTSLYYKEVKLSMSQKMQCSIISLEEILYELLMV